MLVFVGNKIKSEYSLYIEKYTLHVVPCTKSIPKTFLASDQIMLVQF